MRAYVLNGIGDISLEEVKTPSLDGAGIIGRNSQPSVPDEDCVIVRVKAAGICGSDIPRIYKTGAYFHPLIPGHEFSGEIAETGSRVPGNLVGRRVGVFPLIPCGKCSSCKKRKYEMCTGYNYLGSRCDGGFAEYVKVPFKNIIELPAEVSFEQAAMLEPMSVALHAIRQCGLDSKTEDKGQPIAICGLGTIGLFTVMHLLGMGYSNLICIGKNDHQKKQASELGIPEERFIDVQTGEAIASVMKLTNNEGVSTYFECVGSNDAISLGLDVLAASGKLQLVGNPASDMTFDKNTYWKILRKQFVITGTWNSSFTLSEYDDWHLVMKALKLGKIEPEKIITHRLSFEELGKGFEMMRDKTERYTKVMCLV